MELLILGVCLGIGVVCLVLTMGSAFGSFTLAPIPDDDSNSFYTLGIELAHNQSLLKKHFVILVRKRNSHN